MRYKAYCVELFPIVFQRCFFTFLLAVLFATFAPSAHCHPHAFVTTSYTVVFDTQGVKGVRVSWVFDEMYSATVGTDYDLDGDGSFSTIESEKLISLGNESLPQFSYFTHIHIDGKPYEVKSVRDFSIRYEEGYLTYDFYVDCPVKASKEGKQIKISPHDKEFFLAMLFRSDQPVILENSDQFNVTTEVGEDQDTLIYFESMHPLALHLEFKKK